MPDKAVKNSVPIPPTAPQRRRLNFGLRSMFLLVAFAAVVSSVLRVHPMLAAFTAFAAGLISIMAWYAWSDMAMSICTVLLVAGAIAALAMAAAI